LVIQRYIRWLKQHRRKRKSDELNNNGSIDKYNSEDDLDDSDDNDETDEDVEYGDEYGINKLRKMTLAQKPLMTV